MAQIIIPLIHLKDTKSDKQVDAEQKTCVTDTMERENRTVLSINTDVAKNPIAMYVLSGVCNAGTAITIMNTLCAARYKPMQRITDEYYVTHVLKRFDFFDYDGEYLYAMNSSITQFMQMTSMDVSAMRLAVVIETVLGTLHPFYLTGPILKHTADVSKMKCPPSAMPVNIFSHMEAIHAYLPLRVMPTTMRLNFRYKDGQMDFTFGATLHQTENKREVL